MRFVAVHAEVVVEYSRADALKVVLLARAHVLLVQPPRDEDALRLVDLAELDVVVAQVRAQVGVWPKEVKL